jgi:hypothetical protein
VGVGGSGVGGSSVGGSAVVAASVVAIGCSSGGSVDDPSVHARKASVKQIDASVMLLTALPGFLTNHAATRSKEFFIRSIFLHLFILPLSVQLHFFFPKSDDR